MIKKLTKHGNSLALIIDRPVLDLLNIDLNTMLKVTTDGESLNIKPVKNMDRIAMLSDFLDETNKKYGRTLKKLAE